MRIFPVALASRADAATLQQGPHPPSARHDASRLLTAEAATLFVLLTRGRRDSIGTDELRSVLRVRSPSHTSWRAR